MWNRPLVSELFAMSIQRVINDNKKDFDIILMATVTGAESKDVCRRYDIPFVEGPNNPVSRKWNRGLEEALKQQWDYLLIMGDDDIMSSDLLTHYKPYMEGGYNYFGVDTLYFYSPVQHRAVHYTYSYPTPQLIGCGCMISREAVEDTGWKVMASSKADIPYMGTTLPANHDRFLPMYQAKHLQGKGILRINSAPVFQFWRDGIDRGLDSDKDNSLVFNGYRPYVVKTPAPMITDVKTKQNIWSFSHFTGLDYPTTKVENATAFFSQEEKEFVKQNLLR